MSSDFVIALGCDFAHGVVLDDENRVVSVDIVRFPALACVRVGAVVLSINNVPTVRAREEQAQFQSFTGEIMLVLSSPAKDEFDLSSDEDDNGSPFKPPTALPQLSPEYNNTVARNSAAVILEAAQKCGPGKCVIIMCEGANPALPITIAAEQGKVDVMYIDTVARMKTRQKIDYAGEVIKRSLEKGLWIYLEQATKSITLLRKLAECIAEVEASRTMHKTARVFLMCEPHPHFPEGLMSGCVTLRSRLQGDNTAKVDVKEDLLESQRRRNVIHGTEASVGHGAPRNCPEVTSVKKVKISNEVNIVHMETSTFLEMSASAHPTADRDNVSGEGLTRVAKYSFGSGEKFISLCKVRDHRFAVGTNSGYVVLLDGDGLPLIQFRPHKACVWDVSFASPFDFSTACEDGTSTIFNYSLACQELTTTSVASFQSDVFAVTYADDNDLSSAVLSGGLSATICVLHSDRQTSSFIASGTSIQAMCATRRGGIVVGGGNGACSLIDPARCVVVDSTSKHTRKVPAVSSYGDIAVTGGFDRMLRMWDVRSGFQMTFERTLDHFITAVAVSDKYVAVCGGSELFVWDLRKMGTALATKHNAWKDLTRGLVIDENLIVTASVDGVARFWEVN